MHSERTIQEVIAALDKCQLPISTPVTTSNQLHEVLAERLNFLVTNNFSLLISILYRLDISEKKLKQCLKDSKGNTAGDIIAALIIERQLQKIQSRQNFSQNSSDIPEEEKW